MAWLFETEVKGIQRYILATDKLREMAGASGLIEDLAGALRELVGSGGRVEAAAAGRATVVFHSLDALERFRSTWPLRVARMCPGLSVAQAWSKLEEGGDRSRTEEAVRQRLRAEAKRPWVDLPEAGPWVARAGRTGLPAEVPDPAVRGILTRDGSVDAATARKILRFARDDALEAKLEIAGAPRFAKDSDELGEGYVGIIHADGNRVGALISERRPPFDEFSRSLGEATIEAARAATARVWERMAERGEERPRVLPIRPIVLGGDDLTVIVEAREALTFAKEYLAAFEREARSRLEKLLPGVQLTAAAGIAFVKVGFPFHEGYELAEDLCKEAKRVEGEPPGPRPSRLAFHRVTTAVVRSWKKVKEEELAVEGGSLFAGPWTLERLDDLAELAAALKAFPRGAVRTWLRLAKEDPARAERHWNRIREVIRPATARTRLDRALERLGARPHDPWMSGRKSPIAEAWTWLGIDRVPGSKNAPALEAKP